MCLYHLGIVLGPVQGGSAPLGWETRVKVGEGSARGIAYLHTMQDRPLVHRDIKSANILLDHDLTPKVSYPRMIQKTSME